MPGMVGNPIFELNHRGNPPPGPELAPKAIGCGPPVQELGQAGELRGGEPARGPGWRTAAQSVGTLLAGALHPLADGACADAKCLSNLALRPPLLLEVPGLQPSGFFPVGR
jgi:hypothetical protein